MCNKAIICLGSNAPEAAAYIRRAFGMLTAIGTVLSHTDVYPTAPEHTTDPTPYHNMVVEMSLGITADEARSTFKAYEAVVRPTVAAPLVAIDIDIVVWNGEVVRPADYTARYFRQGYDALTKSRN